MTRKIAISVPDDIAEHLGHVSNVSAYITDSVRRRIRSEVVRIRLRDAGLALTEDHIAAAGDDIDAATAAITPELRAQAASLRATVLGAAALDVAS